MSIELKIKNKHLSEEAKIIRFEERKLLKQVTWDKEQFFASGSNGPFVNSDYTSYNSYHNINFHRRWDVRNENRATYLARAYIDGKSYKSIEYTRKPGNEFKFNQYILPRVVAMVAKYGEKKIPLKVYQPGGMVNNPALIELKTAIEVWIAT